MPGPGQDKPASGLEHASARGPSAAPGTGQLRLRLAMLAVALVGFGAAALGIGVQALEWAHAAVDEPQYLLTAISLGEDGSVDISDELRTERWRPFAEVAPPVQTAVLADGRQVSPHDPLLPLLLALPVRWGGWLAAKWTLATLNGVLAGTLLMLAVRRFGVRLAVAAPGVALAAATAPLAVYGQQVYPELPAALAVTLAALALTGPLRASGLLAAGAAVTALPWLSVKYAPVAATLAALALWRLRPRRRTALAGAWLVAGAAYLAIHRAVWGGWTVYASGDEFARGGELGVVGFHPDYPGRSIRLVGLLVDRDFGLAAWQPAWLLAVPAVAALVAARPRHWAVLAAPLAAGWLNATYVALTMQGYWWPGRQVVVVLPLAAVAVLWWVQRLHPVGRAACAGLAMAGVGIYLRVLAAGWDRRTTWMHAPDETGLHPVVWWLLPDTRELDGGDYVRLVLWTVAVLAVLAVSWQVTRLARLARRPGRHGRSTGRPPGPPAAAGRTSWTGWRR